MQSVRRKSESAFALPYIKLAADRGIALSWDYYETMLPQDGFGLLGLSCSDCLMGPCRINPFDKHDRRGICGLGRDAMALRALRGAAGLSPSEDMDISAGVARLFDDAMESLEDGMTKPDVIKTGLGVLDAAAVNIAICGVEKGFAAELAYTAGKYERLAREAGGSRFNIVSVGGLYASSGVNAASCAGDAEAALLTGLVDACVIGAGYPCRARTLEGIVHTSYTVACGGFGGDALEGLLRRACKTYGRRGEGVPCTEISSIETVALPPAMSGDNARICVIGGTQTVKQPQQSLLLKVVTTLKNAGILTVCVGDAAVAFATARKSGGVMAVEAGAVRSLAEMLSGRPSGRTAVYFPSLCTHEDVRLLMALSGSAPALYSSRLPIDGSEAVRSLVGDRMKYVPNGQAVQRLLTLLGLPSGRDEA